MKIILPKMYVTSGFSSSSKFDCRLTPERCTSTEQEIATDGFNSSIVKALEVNNCLNNNHSIIKKDLQPYIYQTFSTYITQNHILKQS
ncbi:hypothetical protein [Winogradskyella psychrotolerans]|uniref:hypothetical protein n=1 Tax=Winogradskyella psychrotolerans TaxID=1344585 RepID=UPI001C06ADBE|nr:hypothetical protein [Winogradskyella psychrotolerans]MBU2927213.1 hypothetical protein [Winogradskyella psychrotolerans]